MSEIFGFSLIQYPDEFQTCDDISEKNKQTAMVGVTLSKLDKAIDAINTKLDTQSTMSDISATIAKAGGAPGHGGAADGALGGLGGKKYEYIIIVYIL